MVVDCNHILLILLRAQLAGSVFNIHPQQYELETQCVKHGVKYLFFDIDTRTLAYGNLTHNVNAVFWVSTLLDNVMMTFFFFIQRNLKYVCEPMHILTLL